MRLNVVREFPGSFRSLHWIFPRDKATRAFGRHGRSASARSVAVTVPFFHQVPDRPAGRGPILSDKEWEGLHCRR
eukprot:50050-Pyramimonas_sp.AAC.1